MATLPVHCAWHGCQSVNKTLWGCLKNPLPVSLSLLALPLYFLPYRCTVLQLAAACVVYIRVHCRHLCCVEMANMKPWHNSFQTSKVGTCVGCLLKCVLDSVCYCFVVLCLVQTSISMHNQRAATQHSLVVFMVRHTISGVIHAQDYEGWSFNQLLIVLCYVHFTVDWHSSCKTNSRKLQS